METPPHSSPKPNNHSDSSVIDEDPNINTSSFSSIYSSSMSTLEDQSLALDVETVDVESVDDTCSVCFAKDHEIRDLKFEIRHLKRKLEDGKTISKVLHGHA